MGYLDTTFKVVVTGDRKFNNFQLFYEKLDKLLSQKRSEITIISGGDKGADLLAEAYATERGHRLLVKHIDWKLGKNAGYIKREEMIDMANAVIIFSNTVYKTLVVRAKERNIPLRIIKY